MGVCKVLFVSLKTGVSVPQSYGSLVIKSHWASRSDSLRTPSPFVRSPGWEAWRGVQNLRSGGRTSLVVLFSSLWVAHLAGMGFEFIVIVPLLPSHCGVFVSGCGASFSVGSSVLLEWWWSAASCSSGALAGGDEHTPFSSAIVSCCRSSLYILDIDPPLDRWFANIFSWFKSFYWPVIETSWAEVEQNKLHW